MQGKKYERYNTAYACNASSYRIYAQKIRFSNWFMTIFARSWGVRNAPDQASKISEIVI